jgi:AcrR family transcriptional regulator
MPLMKALPAQPRPYHHGDLRRALIDATMALVTEEQDWSFSLREVARRAGVSHNAPYNHFAEKRDLLGAVAAMGFEMLRDRMLAVITKIRSADAALSAAANAYVGFAIENPALYRLMFGPVLAAGRSHSTRPVDALIAGAEAKAVLEDIILKGARSRLFIIEPDDGAAQEAATLSCWAALHGLAMLIIDAKVETALPDRTLVDCLLRYLFDGLRHRPESVKSRRSAVGSSPLASSAKTKRDDRP